eukprot:CAMPEP_0178387962 /NCGR_PEP_ID=MMETSP0689_2-20121128/9347_1 /TAXON_ID=160604 /ORGANISM="Amphidinium massartii, Strain CS-259" /LENGTH=377 /DNA_ID=CAMNT_0020008349 /DNA_START=95 /DNA_END=1228 /DNA_ORIENTATION=-
MHVPPSDEAGSCRAEHRAGADEAALVQLSSKRVRSKDYNDLYEDGKMIDKVVFIKTQSTGSSTLTSILHWFCENHHKRCFIYPEGLASGSTVQREGLLSILTEEAGYSLDIWPNHVILETDLLDELIPGNFKISLFREPLSRLMSSFRHVEPSVSGSSAEDALLEAQTVLDALKNGTVPDKCGNAAVKMSKQVPIEKFQDLDFILLTEEYDLSLMMLRRALGWSVRDMLYRRMKDEHNEELTEVVEELQTLLQGNSTPAVEEFLAECSGRNDTVVYQLAREAFEQQWHSFSTEEQMEINADLRVFQAALAALEECCDSHVDDALCQHMAIDNVEWQELARETQHDGIVRFTEGVGSVCMQVADAALIHNATMHQSLS